MDNDATNENFDFSTLEGVQIFIEHCKEEVGRMLFQTHGLMPMFALIANKNSEGQELKVPEALMLAPIQDWKKMRKVMRNSYGRFHAEGALRVHNEGRRILFQLEHAKFGDLVWYTTADDTHMLGKLFGPVPLEKLETPVLKILPVRYMN